MDSSLSNPVMEDMAAGTFRALCEHLRQRGDQIQNIDLMTVGGFCRNCLAKWLVLEARKLSNLLRDDETVVSTFCGIEEESTFSIVALDLFGYDEAAILVYGESYPEWKKRHQKVASQDQLRQYELSAHLHANHDDALLLRKGSGVNIQENSLSERLVVRLQAGAFISLCQHLRTRSDEVQNIDLMAVGGFCRNCLAKWLVVQARKISNRISGDRVASFYFPEKLKDVIKSLDLFGYDEAAQFVYGCAYPEWKRLHQRETTDEQMEKFNASKHLHAIHDNEGIHATSSKNSYLSPNTQLNRDERQPICILGQTERKGVLSDVCCQDVETLVSKTATRVAPSTDSVLRPPKGDLALKVGILTISDRAAADEYETGDLSGPAVESTMITRIDQMNNLYEDQHISILSIEKCVVADEIPRISQVLKRWSGKTTDTENPAKDSCDLVFTTGGTGFARRDVTPEATLSVIDRECQGLMSWASMELSSKQPYATLSRATAGVCNNTLIVNLPGNPTGAAQMVEFLFPLLLHALKELHSSD